MRCPKCREKSEVLETETREGRPTRRRRRCLNPHCQHRFTTAEEALENMLRVTGEGDLVRELRRVGGKPRKGYDPEALAAAICVDRRKQQIAREQRQRVEQYDGEDGPPRRLNRFTMRRELQGY
jgi:transcriptional regulator NrdR family protein